MFCIVAIRLCKLQTNYRANTLAFLVLVAASHGKELGWTVYCITSLTLTPSQPWQLHYCYWPLLYLSIFSPTSWNNIIATETLLLLKINLCSCTTCNNSKLWMFTAAHSLWSIPDPNSNPEIISSFPSRHHTVGLLRSVAPALIIGTYTVNVWPGQHGAEQFGLIWLRNQLRIFPPTVSLSGRCQPVEGDIVTLNMGQGCQSKKKMVL